MYKHSRRSCITYLFIYLALGAMETKTGGSSSWLLSPHIMLTLLSRNEIQLMNNVTAITATTKTVPQNIQSTV